MQRHKSSSTNDKMKYLLALLAVCTVKAAPQFGPEAVDQNVPLVPLVVDLFAVDDFGPISIEIADSSEEIRLPLTDEQLRLRLIRYMRKLEREIEEDIFENDYFDIQESLMKLDTQVWPKIVSLSNTISNKLVDQKMVDNEIQLHHQLKQDLARIRYKAGARKCIDHNEAYYGPNQTCVQVGSTDPALNPCIARKDQVLYEGANNKALCDCIEDERHLIFSDIDGQCHMPNQQGPCRNNTWLVITHGKPVCEPVPADCPADGQHVFGSYDPLVAKPQCLKLGVRGPCIEGTVLGRNGSGELACVGPQLDRSRIQLRPSCRLGSLRAQNNQCPL